MTEKPTSEELEKTNQKFKREEYKRKETEEALNGALQYARGLIEANLDALMTISTNGKIIDVNKTSELITGRSRKEIIGTKFSIYFTDPDGACRGLEQVLKDGAVMDYPLEVKHRDGRIIPVLYNISTYKDSQGNMANIIASARNISEIKQAEEKRKKLIKELQEALENVKVLSGFLTICSSCKKIRDDKGYWSNFEEYFQTHYDVSFTHGMCPKCLDELYGKEDWFKEIKKEQKE